MKIYKIFGIYFEHLDTGYMLADHGYDVWLGNKRGNTYSRDHVTHDPDGRRGDRRRFWDFSWHHVSLFPSFLFFGLGFLNASITWNENKSKKESTMLPCVTLITKTLR